MSNTSTSSILKRDLVFPVKQRVDETMLEIFAGIVVISEKEKKTPLVVFRTKGGLVSSASTIINVIKRSGLGVDFLIEEEASSAGILILSAGRKVFAKKKAIFQWHHHRYPAGLNKISQEEIEWFDWSKAVYLSSVAHKGLEPQFFFDLMTNNKILVAEEMEEIGLVHKIIP